MATSASVLSLGTWAAFVAVSALGVRAADGRPVQGAPTLADRIAAASPGDTIRVPVGVHGGPFIIDRPLTLRGEPGAVLDGGGTGTVLRVTAPDVTVADVTIRASGPSLSREDAGLMAIGADRLRVEGVSLNNVLFGISLKESHAAALVDNDVVGKALEPGRRGDGIRLWYSHGAVVRHNTLRQVRDLVIWFSDSARVTSNDVRDSRYGLHYMYSDHTVFADNRLIGNRVGAYLMYSRDVTLRENRFERATGSSGMGVGIKDTDDVHASGNLVIGNGTGIYLDNSPTSVGSRNRFEGNRIHGNDIGVGLLPAVQGNDFVRNEWWDNVRDVAVTGGGHARANRWEGNAWDRYVGFDENDDGAGDTPFVLTRLSDHLTDAHPALATFTFSPAALVLDLVTRVLPFLAPEPLLVDPSPRVDR